MGGASLGTLRTAELAPFGMQSARYSKPIAISASSVTMQS